ALHWVFISAHPGAPELGVRGAAIASSLASWLAFALLLGLFVGRSGVAKRSATTLRTTLRLGELGRMLRFGLPNGLNWALEFGAFSVFVNVIVVDLGTTALAGLMAVVQVNSVSFMPAF